MHAGADEAASVSAGNNSNSHSAQLSLLYCPVPPRPNQIAAGKHLAAECIGTAQI